MDNSLKTKKNYSEGLTPPRNGQTQNLPYRVKILKKRTYKTHFS